MRPTSTIFIRNSTHTSNTVYIAAGSTSHQTLYLINSFSHYTISRTIYPHLHTNISILLHTVYTTSPSRWLCVCFNTIYPQTHNILHFRFKIFYRCTVNDIKVGMHIMNVFHRKFGKQNRESVLNIISGVLPANKLFRLQFWFLFYFKFSHYLLSSWFCRFKLAKTLINFFPFCFIKWEKWLRAFAVYVRLNLQWNREINECHIKSLMLWIILHWIHLSIRCRRAYSWLGYSI